MEYIDPTDACSLIDEIMAALNNMDEPACKGEKIAFKFSFKGFTEEILGYYGRSIIYGIWKYQLNNHIEFHPISIFDL